MSVVGVEFINETVFALKFKSLILDGLIWHHVLFININASMELVVLDLNLDCFCY